MRHYCTYFDSHYLLRGLTMFRSLCQHDPQFMLWVLCCDATALQALQKLDLPNLRPVALSEVEAFEPRLQQAKTNRSRVEYFWTLTPIWPLFLLQSQPQIESLTYLDADQFFFASPAPIFAEIGDAPISIFSHRYNDADRPMEINGIYNVGWVGFRRGETARACLEKWANQCLAWCYGRTENGKYGDQKYLDEWLKLYPETRVVEHSGAGIAPWNWMNCEFQKPAHTLLCDGAPLIFFHFHGLRIFNSWLYDTFYTTRIYGHMPAQTRRWIFNPYIRAMIETARWARGRGCRLDFGYTPPRKYIAAYGKRLFLTKLWKRGFIFHPGLQ